MTCVAQGGPYLLGSVVALRAMTTSARRKRSGPGATPVEVADGAPAAEPATR